MNNEKINLKIKLPNNSSFVLLVFVILKFQNIGRSTFYRSKFSPPHKNWQILKLFVHSILIIFFIFQIVKFLIFKKISNSTI